MALLDEITEKLGGQQGKEGGLASMQQLLASSGGLQGLARKLQSGGLGQQLQSWIGTGENKPVTGSQVQHAIDPQQVDAMTRQSGMTPEQTCDHVAQALPHLVSRATPDGKLPPPENDPLSKGVEALRRVLQV